MASTEDIREMVKMGLPEAEVRVVDLTGTGDHFEVTVITQAFTNKSLVDRHRMVYEALGPAVGMQIHAVTLKTSTPDESGKI